MCKRTFLILPGCDDTNRGDQALIWETVSLAKDAGFQGEYFMIADKEKSRQSVAEGIGNIDYILKHPSTHFKKKNNINTIKDIPNVTLPGTSGSSSNPNDIFAGERFFSAYIRLILYEIVTKSHSIPMFSRPRIKNWRNPITRFIIPKTGSTVVFLFE